MSTNKKSSVNLTTRQKSSWLELTIEDGKTKIVTSVWLDELKSLKENLEETTRIMKVYDDYLITRTGLKRKQL